MAYEKNQYSYFQNVTIDDNGYLLVKIADGGLPFATNSEALTGDLHNKVLSPANLKYVLNNKPTSSESNSLLLNTDPLIYADGKQGKVDPSGTSGWYFTNEVIAEKINWYYVANTNLNTTMTLATLKNQYALVEVVKEREPFFVVYTKPQFDGNDAALWYRSRLLYFTYGAWDGLSGTTQLVYWGEEPNAFTDVSRVEFEFDPMFSAGPQDPSEEILVANFSSDSSASPGTYEFVVKNLGYTNGVSTTDFLLHAQPPALPFVYTETPVEYANTHYITLDASNDYIDLNDVDVKVMDFTEKWAIGIEIESVSSVNDASYSALFSRGNNQITLRKGGSNWGFYVHSNGVSVGQANTWYAPSAGSKVLFISTGTHIKYYLDGYLRANVAINSNVSNQDPSGNLQVGKPATSNAGYWYGGLNNLFIMAGDESTLGVESVNAYFVGEDVTQMDFYESAVDFLPLGEGTYPEVNGLKSVVTGRLENGTSSDFVER